jgi:competence ComEA-like helix-hairpin-helix protein
LLKIEKRAKAQEAHELSTRQENGVSKNLFKNLDLNTATEQELTFIFGSDYAQKIVDYRNQNGPFKSWEDLKRIPGILGPMVDTLKRLGCTVGQKAA